MERDQYGNNDKQKNEHEQQEYEEDQLDPEELQVDNIQEELNNEWSDWDFEEEEDLEETPVPSRVRKLRKVFAAIVLIVFATTAFSGLFSTLAVFPLEAYLESLELTRNSDIEDLRKGVVLVNSYESRKRNTLSRRQTGTGFNIDSSGKVLTNRHVIENSEEITISFRDVQETYTLASWKLSPHPGLDLAVVDVPGENLPYLEMAEEPAKHISEGEEVVIIGNPRGVGGLAVEGEITGINSLSELPHVIMQIDSSIHPGHSGSPVFNKDREVIGIIYASRELADGEEVGLAISLESYGILQ